MVSSAVLALTLFVGASLAAPSRNEWPDVFNLKTRAAMRSMANENVVKSATETSTRVHPSVVQMDFYWANFGGWSHVCAGTIVTSMAVVSAARCTDVFFDSFYQESNRRIRAGADYRHTGGQLANVLSVSNHPNFNYETMDYDISVVRLSTPLIFGDNIRSVSILPQNYALPDRSSVIYAGWGAEENSVLLDARASTINQEECVHEHELPLNLRVTKNVFCAVLPYVSADFCFMEIGGPIYFQNILSGVGHFGPCSCDDIGHPIVNINVASFSDWIVANA